MGRVLRYAEKSCQWQTVPEESARLLSELTRSLSFMWSGGWAELDDDGQVVILHHQSRIGAWALADDGLTFSYDDETRKPRFAASVDEAVRQTLMLVMQPSSRNV